MTARVARSALVGRAPSVEWYRSNRPAPTVQPSTSRIVRTWLRRLLPEPDVRGKTVVLVSRRSFPTPWWGGIRSQFHGLFSEFHSVLGALAWAEGRGAVGVRVDFRSPLYVDPDCGPNWWTYFFDSALMRLAPADAARGEPGIPARAGLGDIARGAVVYPARGELACPEPRRRVEPRAIPPVLRRAQDERDVLGAEEVRLNGVITKYGRYGGFSDLVQGSTPYLYPMTYGLSRAELNRLLTEHVHVRPEISDEVTRFIAARFEPGAYVVGVHYRGTDATHNWTGAFTHYRMSPVPYTAYAEEVRVALDTASPRTYQVFVATDEIDCLEFMQREFGDRVVHFDESPRVHATSQAVHLDRSLPVANYQKGKSALVDCLLLAATRYLVKGRSNLSDASLVFNQNLPYSFCPDVRIRPS